MANSITHSISDFVGTNEGLVLLAGFRLLKSFCAVFLPRRFHERNSIPTRKLVVKGKVITPSLIHTRFSLSFPLDSQVFVYSYNTNVVNI